MAVYPALTAIHDVSTSYETHSARAGHVGHRHVGDYSYSLYMAAVIGKTFYNLQQIKNKNDMSGCYNNNQ